MRIMLRTADGATRIVEGPDSGYPIFRVPLPNVYDAEAELKRDPEWVPPTPKVREFIRTGEIPVYDEKLV